MTCIGPSSDSRYGVPHQYRPEVRDNEVCYGPSQDGGKAPASEDQVDSNPPFQLSVSCFLLSFAI